MVSNRQKLELLREASVRKARGDFLHFRKLINPKSVWGWWQVEVAGELRAFYDALVNGERPRLVIQAPPQHGKTTQVVDFIAWLAGRDPDCRTIYTSFSERLGVRANLRLQRIYDSAIYSDIFPSTRINQSSAVAVSGQHLRNREILEYVGHSGYFRNTTVRGSITGESLDLGVIDDPIRGRADAGSPTVRNSSWDWLTDDFFTRFSERAGMLAILTRWHLDDPIGRLIERDSSIKVLTYKAIADEDEEHRLAGDALFPELKSREFLLERKSVMDAASWMSLYQQSPIVLGGEIIKSEWFGDRYTIVPHLKYRGIFADTAQKTKEHNDYSVFQCWGCGEDGRIYLLDMIRGKWEAPELKRRALAFWEKHNAETDRFAGQLRQLAIEDKASGTGLIQDIRMSGSIPVVGIARTTDKLSRVMDVVSYIEAGLVRLPNAPWVSDFLAECEAFTADDTHAHDDQIDPMVDAINNMLVRKSSVWDNL